MLWIFRQIFQAQGIGTHIEQLPLRAMHIPVVVIDPSGLLLRTITSLTDGHQRLPCICYVHIFENRKFEIIVEVVNETKLRGDHGARRVVSIHGVELV